MQNLHLSESAHGLTAKHPGLTPSRPSELGSTSKIGRFGYSPLPIRCFEHFCIFIYLIFNYIYIYEHGKNLASEKKKIFIISVKCLINLVSEWFCSDNFF